MDAMELHEVKTFIRQDTHIRVLRVPGGWIYSFCEERAVGKDDREWQLVSSVFVPLSNEFQEVLDGK